MPVDRVPIYVLGKGRVRGSKGEKIAEDLMFDQMIETLKDYLLEINLHIDS